MWEQLEEVQKPACKHMESTPTNIQVATACVYSIQQAGTIAMKSSLLRLTKGSPNRPGRRGRAGGY